MMTHNFTFLQTGYLNDLWRYSSNEWTWMGGNSTSNVIGVYGTKGTSSPSNYPGGRYNSVSWIDSSGALWLFGGQGIDSTGTYGMFSLISNSI